jgi:hypothetical protein
LQIVLAKVSFYVLKVILRPVRPLYAHRS